MAFLVFLGTCPVCGKHYDQLDHEVGHEVGGSEVFEVIVDDPDLAADKGDRVDRACETCHTAGRVRRIVDR